MTSMILSGLSEPKNGNGLRLKAYSPFLTLEAPEVSESTEGLPL